MQGRKIKTLIDNCFFDGEWYVAYKKNNEKEFQIIKNPRHHWFADPFVVENNGEIYVFCEGYDNIFSKGSIYCIPICRDETPCKIIENRYHMSYPHVFKFGDSYYMIPESAENHTLDLYQCTDFPFVWHKERTLIENFTCVDTNVLIKDKYIYLITLCLDNEEKGELVVFQYNFHNPPKELFRMKNRDNCQRNAGGCFFHKGDIIRPCQNNKIKYGESIVFKKVVVSNEKYEETPLSELKIQDLNVSSDDYMFERVHTYNKSISIEVVDMRNRYFNAFLILKKMIRKFQIGLRCKKA